MQQRCNDGSTSYQADSCSNLGTMYFSGDGVQKDLDKAAKYYYKACETGKSPDSCKVHNQIMQMMEMQNK